MDAYGNDYLKQVDSLLASGSQSWLFGAGISLNEYPTNEAVDGPCVRDGRRKAGERTFGCAVL
jgi:hypothetical protein